MEQVKKDFDLYLLNLLKKQQNRKKQKQIVKDGESGLFNYNLDAESSKYNKVFDSFKDYLVVKGFVIDNIASSFKINKSIASNFVSRLSSDDVYLLSNGLKEFQNLVKANSPNVNDYILKSSFSEFRKLKQIEKQQEKNEIVMVKAEEENKEAIEESKIEEGDEGVRVKDEDKVGVKAEEEEVESPSTINLKDAYDEIISRIEIRDLTDEEKTLFLNKLYPDRFVAYSTFKRNINATGRDLEDTLRAVYRRLTGKNVSFSKGNGMMKQIRGYGLSTSIQKQDFHEYIPISSKYVVSLLSLRRGLLVVRTKHKINRVGAFPTRHLTPKLQKIILKLVMENDISYADVDELNSREKNELFEIGKMLGVKKLFDIPSTLKTDEDKLRDKFELLKGQISAGNDNPDTIKKFKLVLFKMRNNGLITRREYNQLVELLMAIE